jgi:hypothetical protein
MAKPVCGAVWAGSILFGGKKIRREAVFYIDFLPPFRLAGSN